MECSNAWAETVMILGFLVFAGFTLWVLNR